MYACIVRAIAKGAMPESVIEFTSLPFMTPLFSISRFLDYFLGVSLDSCRICCECLLHRASSGPSSTSIARFESLSAGTYFPADSIGFSIFGYPFLNSFLKFSGI